MNIEGRWAKAAVFGVAIGIGGVVFLAGREARPRLEAVQEARATVASIARGPKSYGVLIELVADGAVEEMKLVVGVDRCSESTLDDSNGRRSVKVCHQEREGWFAFDVDMDDRKVGRHMQAEVYAEVHSNGPTLITTLGEREMRARLVEP